MPIDAERFVFAIGLVLLVAFVGHLIFRRTRLPDVLLLVAVGLLLGPTLKLLPSDAIQAMIPLVGIAAIVLILFDGGVKLNIHDLLGGLGPAFALGLLGFVATVFLVAGVHNWITGADPFVSLILGCVLGGSSSIVVLPLANAMNIEKRAKTVLGLESVLTDVLVIVGVITLSSAVQLQEADPQNFLRDFAQLFALGAVLGAGAGALWVWVLRTFFEERSYEYMLTLAVLAVLYTTTNYLGGSSAVAVLTFAVVLGNGRRTERLTGSQATAARRRHQSTFRLVPVFNPELIRLHDEMVFFIRAFFFVALGVIIDIQIFTDPDFFLASLLFVAAMLLARFWAMRLLQWRLRFPAKDFYATWFLNGRGIAAAAVASVPLNEFGILEAADFPAYALAAIVFTNITTSLAVFVLENRRVSARLAAA